MFPTTNDIEIIICGWKVMMQGVVENRKAFLTLMMQRSVIQLILAIFRTSSICQLIYPLFFLQVNSYLNDEKEKHYKKIIWEKLNQKYFQVIYFSI